MILNDQRNGKHGICVKEYIDTNICFLLQFLNGVSVSNCHIRLSFNGARKISYYIAITNINPVVTREC